MNQQQRDLYEATLESLTNHPEQWEGDNYRVRHPSGVEVWTANAHYGLDIKVNGEAVVGGVTGWSSFFGGLIPWRRKLRRAATAVVVSTPLTSATAALRGEAP